jgi:putative hydrolase of the HAD superfamily
MGRLKAVFMDIDDTLYSTSEFAEMARENAVRAMVEAGLRMKPEDVKLELDEVIGEFSSNYEHHFDKLLLRIPRRYYKGMNPALIVAAGMVAYHDTKFTQLKPYEDVKEVLRRLADTDLILGVITAGLTIKQSEKLIRLGLLEYFHPNALFISEQIGISKPNVKLYQRACSDLNLRPSETMYVGDSPAHDIDPPNQIGMITVHNARGGRHIAQKSHTKPAHTIHNFWDLMDILISEYGIEF